jgi:hypothetical protein
MHCHPRGWVAESMDFPKKFAESCASGSDANPIT